VNPDKTHYRGVQRASIPWLRSIYAIWRNNLRMIVRYRVFWVIMAISMLHFFVHYVLIYIKAQIALEGGGWFVEMIDNFQVTGNGEGYYSFLAQQSSAVIVMLAYASSVMVASDYSAGGIVFYLSKPIGKLHWIVGKTLSLMAVVSLQTLIPALILYIECGVYSPSMLDYWRDNGGIAFSIIGYSLVIMLVLSIIALAVGVLCKRTAPLIMVWGALVLVLPAFAEMLRTILDNQNWMLLHIPRNCRLIGRWLFDVLPDDSLSQIPIAAGVLLAAVVASLVILQIRLRPVEVVG
jgi:ABC-2 type transport system permease protein